MDMQKLQEILAVIGAVAFGLPALLHALVLFFKAIPGDQPDKALEAVLGVSEKISALVGKIFPQPKK